MCVLYIILPKAAILFKYPFSNNIGMSQISVFEFAQKLGAKPIHSINDVIPFSTSTRTAYRHLRTLKNLGFITKSRRGYFMTNDTAISQPAAIRDKLVPSLKALKLAKRFGKYYNDSDINFAINNIQTKLITLDYKAWELTKYQYPSELYMYVENFDKAISFLKENKFNGGQRRRKGLGGRIVILPMIGDFSNEIERVYLDCIAKGGRNIQDAIAIQLLYGDHLKSKGIFPAEYVLKVQEDLPNEKKISE
jgi:hypothetical protein